MRGCDDHSEMEESFQDSWEVTCMTSSMAIPRVVGMEVLHCGVDSRQRADFDVRSLVPLRARRAVMECGCRFRAQSQETTPTANCAAIALRSVCTRGYIPALLRSDFLMACQWRRQRRHKHDWSWRHHRRQGDVRIRRLSSNLPGRSSRHWLRRSRCIPSLSSLGPNGPRFVCNRTASHRLLESPRAVR